MGRKVKVSVCVVTYNQANYIEKCLQSIIDQKTNFEFELIVGDDCSTDGTREIIQRFVSRNPQLIRVIPRDENVGAARNYIEVHESAVGEYVAHCDGDDFWYPGKLQYQSDFLDKNSGFSQCWSCAEIVDDNGKVAGVFPSKMARILNPTVVNAKDIAMSYALVGQHSTQMYRRSFWPKLDKNKMYLDYWIAFNLSLSGPAFYDKKILGAYRVTTTPSATRSSSNKKITVDLLALHLVELSEKNGEYARQFKANLLTRAAFSYFAKHDLEVINRCLEKSKRAKISMVGVIRSVLYFMLQKI